MTPKSGKAMGASVRLELPWPPRDLHPNARKHWAVRSKATKRARNDAAWAARAAGLRRMEATALSVTAVFCPPDNRARDTDGMLSNIKAYIDGVADVIGIDDSKWSLSIRREEAKAPGSVTLELAVWNGEENRG